MNKLEILEKMLISRENGHKEGAELFGRGLGSTTLNAKAQECREIIKIVRLLNEKRNGGLTAPHFIMEIQIAPITEEKVADANRRSVLAIIARSAFQDATARLIERNYLSRVNFPRLQEKIREQASSLYDQMKADIKISLKKGGGDNLRTLFFTKIKGIGVYEADQAIKELK